MNTENIILIFMSTIAFLLLALLESDINKNVKTPNREQRRKKGKNK